MNKKTKTLLTHGERGETIINFGEKWEKMAKEVSGKSKEWNATYPHKKRKKGDETGF